MRDEVLLIKNAFKLLQYKVTAQKAQLLLGVDELSRGSICEYVFVKIQHANFIVSQQIAIHQILWLILQSQISKVANFLGVSVHKSHILNFFLQI